MVWSCGNSSAIRGGVDLDANIFPYKPEFNSNSLHSHPVVDTKKHFSS